MALCKAVNGLCRKVVYCPYCSATNGTVKKAGALKIIHDKFRAKKTADEMEKWKKTFSSAVEAQKELAMYISKAVHEDLNPLKVLDLFRRIPDEVSLSLFLRLERAKPCSLGLRTPWIKTGSWTPGRVHLAIYLRTTRLHPSVCRTRWRVKRRRSYGQAHRNRIYKRFDQTWAGKRRSGSAVYGKMLSY